MQNSQIDKRIQTHPLAAHEPADGGTVYGQAMFFPLPRHPQVLRVLKGQVLMYSCVRANHYSIAERIPFERGVGND